MKKTRNSTKIPEQSISEKINHYKGINRTLRKRLDNLEKRMVYLEQKMEKYKHSLRNDIVEKREEETKDRRKDFNKKFNPKYKDTE